MFKKFTAVSLSVIFLFSGCTVFAQASDVPSTPTESNSIVSDSETSHESYETYRERYASYKDFDSVIEADFDAPLETVGDTLSWDVTIPEDAMFQPEIVYTALEATGGDIEMRLTVDGESVYPQLESFLLFRAWKNSTEQFDKNKSGDEYSPEQQEVVVSQRATLLDSDGFVTEPLQIALSQGSHTITLELLSEAVKIEKILLNKPEVLCDYTEYKNSIKDDTRYDGQEIVIEGENATLKSQKSFMPLADRNSVNVSPADPTHKKINYIGGSNWNSLGGAISWELDIKTAGWYKLGFHFRQNYLLEGVSYRKLYVDGSIPFKEASALAFGYKSGWQYFTLKDASDNEMPLYLTPGKHTITLAVTLGGLSDYAKELKDITDVLGKLYRRIVKITGESPDANRDYEIFSAVPELEEQLTDIHKRLEDLATLSETIAGSNGGSNAQIMRKASITIEQMLKVKYEAHTKISTFYDNYASLCSWLYEMQNMALDIDSVLLTAPQKDFVSGKVSLAERFSFFFRRLFSTYVTNDTQTGKQEDESITLWLNWGRDQITLLENLISDDFTPKTGIDVNIKITATSLVQAGLSGNGPDFQLNVDRTAPLNYAMRGLLYDLKQFDDYNDITKRFSAHATVPYEYENGVYGLPSTESFNMLFVRTDVFEELGLEIPKTWDEFINCAKIINLNNMNCGMVSDVGMFLTQMNVPMYTEDRSATNLTSPGAVEAFTFMTDFYTKYKFPVSYSFFNRFRTGLMPMAIAAYSENATLRAAAPEINGKWRMYDLPGFVNDDGTISNAANGTGTACVILNWATDKGKENAWEFLKWWTSDEVQYRYSVNIESLLGASARYVSANVNSVCKLGWDSETLAAIKRQFAQLQNFPEVPGSYYVSRSTQQVFWNVVNNGQDVEDMLEKWIPEADDEIARKTEEYVKK